MSISIVTPDEVNLSQWAFEPFLFSLPSLVKRSSVPTRYLQYEEQQRVQFILPFQEIENKLQSLFRVPFGGFCGVNNVTQEQCQAMLTELIRYAQQHHKSSISITQWPQSFAPSQAEVIHQALLRSEFEVSLKEVNQELSVTAETFISRLHDSEKRRLQKSIRAGFTAEHGAFKDIDTYHALVQRNRIHKGNPLTIDAENLKNILEGSAHHVFFAVYDGEKLIAAATGVRVSSSVLYYYLPGNEPEYDSYSPMVLLLQTMYEYAQQQGITLLDLGISTAGGIMNEGLFRFKKHLGATDSLKLTYEKKI